MRVLHLISSGGMYGAEAVILNLMHTFHAGSAHRCALAIFHHPNHPPPAVYTAALRSGVAPEDVHLLECRGQLDRGVPRRLRALAKLHAADVVHAHGYKADIYAAFAWGNVRPARVSTCHTWYDNDLALRLYGALDRWVLRRFEQTIAVSVEVQQQLLAAGVDPGRVHLIRNGVATESFISAGRQRAQRQTSGGALHIGLVGRLSPEKGVDLFLRAAALVLQKYPEVSFTVAGEGPERSSLEQLVRDLHLEGSVTLPGTTDNMPAFYASLDVLVSASRQEGLPVALLEGLATGLPAVATNVGAVPEIVIDGRTGLLVAPGSPERLAGAMEKLLASPALRSELGAGAGNHVAEHFSAERMAEEYLSVYQQALDLRARATANTGGQGKRRA